MDRTPAQPQQPGADNLVLEVLPNGEAAWLKPRPVRRPLLPSRYWLTDKGHAAIHGDNTPPPSDSSTANPRQLDLLKSLPTWCARDD